MVDSFPLELALISYRVSGYFSTGIECQCCLNFSFFSSLTFSCIPIAMTTGGCFHFGCTNNSFRKKIFNYSLGNYTDQHVLCLPCAYYTILHDLHDSPISLIQTNSLLELIREDNPRFQTWTNLASVEPNL
jgi:hypothetical protein